MTDRIEALESRARAMGVLDQVYRKLTEQNGVLAKLVAPKVHAQPEGQEWTDVVKRPTSGTRNQLKRSILDVASGNGWEAVKAIWSVKPPRTRPLAIMVTTKDDGQFLEVLKAVSSTVDPTVTGNSTAKMRKTSEGNLMIEINGGAEAAEVVRGEVVWFLGLAVIFGGWWIRSQSKSATWMTRSRVKRY